ncbi:hypothetical protein OS188_11695 [Xanthomarina sp. F1114]|uniref:hypothetical protein n=1 Tax=Xanthomarina sp. F1114 TaxID=2996019 RepID=UPI00225DE6A7|nr:hypothetical protein [Xanthomarina sp. F1114]MCX7548614.1 hypothetical protein [Xanthomarina sp. F1114]
MNKILLVFFLFQFQFIVSQEVIINDSLSIEFLKTKKTSKNFNTRSNVKVKGNQSKRILTRCKVKALYDQPVDINAFSLVDTINKMRYRINEYIGYQAVSVFGSGYTSKMYLKKNLKNRKGKPYKGIPEYDKSVKDSFEDFIFEGYTNIEVPLRFGTNRSLAGEFSGKKKEIISTVYYSPTQLDQFTAEIYFIVHNSFPESHLELYYGKQLISEIETD